MQCLRQGRLAPEAASLRPGMLGGFTFGGGILVNMLVLSIFPGMGLLDMAFEQEGYCIVRGPDRIWGGDIRAFHPPAGMWAGVIGGPPCQSFSPLAALVRANGHEPKFGNLIPEFERCVLEGQSEWFLMENVPQAPEPVVAGYGVTSFLLDNSHLNSGDGFGEEQRRGRRFCFGQRGVERPPSLLRWIDRCVFLLPDASPNVTSGTGYPPIVRPVTTRHEAVTGGHDRPPSARDRLHVSAVISSPVGLNGDGHQHSAAGRERARMAAVTSTDGGERPSEKKVVSPTVTSNVGGKRSARKAVSSGGSGQGKERPNNGAGQNGRGGRYTIAEACRLQGLPEDFLDDAPFTAAGKLKAVANGVPLSMGLAIARAIKQALAIS